MTMKRIWVSRKNSFFIAFGATVGFAVFGNILHDIIACSVPDEEMTVFPLGTLLASGGYIFAIIFSGLNGGESFDKVLHMGETRHRCFKDMVLFYLMIFAGVLMTLELTYAFEQWKFRTFFSEFPVEAELPFMQNPLSLIVLLIAGISFSLLLTALGLRFSVKIIGLILWLSCMLFGAGIGRLSDAAFFDTVKGSGNIIPAIVTAISLIAVLISHRLMMRQSAR